MVYSKQPKLGLTQEFVVDCAHALWVVHSIKRLVMLRAVSEWGQSGDDSHLGRTIVRIQKTIKWITVYLNSARRDMFL